MDYKSLMERARETNIERDTHDHHYGFASPSDIPPRFTLRTAMAAIECGISIDDWNCVAEGQAMLEQLEKMLNGKER